jgi:hypothetical protein
MDEGVCHVDIGRGDLPALRAGRLDLLHVPDAEGRSAELGPDLGPSLVLGGLLAVWLALDATYKRPRKVDLARVGGGELDDRPDFWMKWRRGCLRLIERRTRR